MSTKHRSAEKRIGLQTPRHVPLGTDAEGYDHHHAAADDKIYVLDGSQIAHVEDLAYDDGRDWQDWIGYVDKVRGGKNESGWLDLSVAAAVAGGLGGN